MSDFTGYAIEKEDQQWLKDNSTPYEAVYSAADHPPRNVMKWLRTENQGQVGRCCGMAFADAAEVNYWLATRGKIIQFNGHYSYIKAQKYTPELYGRDQGATISSGLKAAMESGLCPTGEGDAPNPDWKFTLPPNYTTQLPAGADEQAAPFKIRSFTWLANTQALIDYVKSGAGAVAFGTGWGNWSPDANGYCRRYGAGGGGHAMSIVDFDEDGNAIGHNSHGTNFGLKGFFKMTTGFLDGMYKDWRTSVVGVSDLTVPKPRKADWAKTNIFF